MQIQRKYNTNTIQIHDAYIQLNPNSINNEDRYCRYQLNLELQKLLNKRGLSQQEQCEWDFECEFCFKSFTGIDAYNNHQSNRDNECQTWFNRITQYELTNSGIKCVSMFAYSL